MYLVSIFKLIGYQNKLTYYQRFHIIIVKIVFKKTEGNDLNDGFKYSIFSEFSLNKF